MKLNKLWILTGYFILTAITVWMNEPAAEAKTISADASEIRYFGRWDKADGVYRCGYGAVYLKANFTGTSLKADLTGKGIWWRVSIDGSDFRRFAPEGRDTVLAKELSEGEHKVLLVRSTEGEAGIAEFRGFEVDDAAQLTPADPVKERRLEFVGDSITAGAENEGPWGNGKGYHDVEDNDMAFGPQLARMLNADYSVIAKSGQGIVQNYGEKWPYQGVHASDSYVWTFFSKDFSPENQEWDTKRFPVDAIIVAYGTNDFSNSPIPPTDQAFREGYQKLIRVIRSKNPGKPIICLDPLTGTTLPGMEDAEADRKVIGLIRQMVEDWNRQGDKDVYFIPVNEGGRLLPPEDLVEGGHPRQSGDTKIANYLKDKVAAILGW